MKEKNPSTRDQKKDKENSEAHSNLGQAKDKTRILPKGRSEQGSIDHNKTILKKGDKNRVSPESDAEQPITNHDNTILKADDKTRIAPGKGPEKSSAGYDKTVLKADDKTRVAPRRGSEESLAGHDKTVIKANEKTRIATRKNRKQPSINQDRTAFPVESRDSARAITQDDLKAEKIINNRFVIKESLGVGGMGMVFRALDLRKEETGDSEPYIAIKILSSEFKEHPQAFISLQREAKKSQLLSHPNVIKVYDFDRDGDLVYLTMEELKGQPLNRLIREYPKGLPQELAIKIILAIGEGLAYAHKKNIVHADLKPDNIFYTDEGEVKIIDFGIARIITDLDAKGNPSGHFDPSEVVGLTPAYASLEMLRDAPAIPSDDVYAIGIIGYELLTGEHPFARESADVAFENNRSYKKIARLKSYQWKAITKALLFEQKNRLKNGAEFRDIFSGKGRNVRNLSIGLILVSAILTISLFIPRGNNMDHLYDELAPAQQNTFNDLIHEGNVLLGFGDWNNALSLFEQAHEILPQHSITEEALSNTVEKILLTLDETSLNLNQELKLQQIDELLKYKSLVDNEKLLEYRAKIQSGD